MLVRCSCSSLAGRNTCVAPESRSAPRAQRTHEGTMAGAGGATAERPFLSPESTQGTALETGLNRPPGGSAPEPELSRDSTRTLDVEVMYGAGGDQGPAVVRWVARLTDFLRTTATGAGGLQDRVLEGLGITGTQGTPSLQQTLTSPQQHPPHPVPQQQLMLPQQQQQGQFTPQRIQQLSPSARRNLVQALNFSPPEELPGTSRTMRQQPGQGLFNADQLQRLRALEMEAPNCMGHPLSTSRWDQRLRLPRRCKLKYNVSCKSS